MNAVSNDLFDALDALGIEDQNKIFKSILRYVLDGVEPELDGYAKAFWILSKEYVEQSHYNYNEKKSLVKKPTKIFKKPTIEEIYNYVTERHPRSDGNKRREFAEHFFNFYESKGWKVGKNSMKNWEAALSTWKDSMNKIIYPQVTYYGIPPKGSWEARQLEYAKGVQSILNDENL
jgi:hypothetical protein